MASNSNGATPLRTNEDVLNAAKAIVRHSFAQLRQEDRMKKEYQAAEVLVSGFKRDRDPTEDTRNHPDHPNNLKKQKVHRPGEKFRAYVEKKPLFNTDGCETVRVRTLPPV